MPKTLRASEAFKRSPSFWDPAWRKTVHDRLVSAVQNNEPYRPYFYCLADESGIADLGAAWDFDFSDQSLVPYAGVAEVPVQQPERTESRMGNPVYHVAKRNSSNHG